MNQNKEKGIFVTFEGGDGSGKSTQCSLLAEALIKKRYEVELTREPGGTEGAEQIRNLLVQGEVNKWDPTTEALLLFAARRDHVIKKIRPALNSGKIVICDRFYDSTIAYQASGYGMDLKTIEKLKDISIGNLSPDITFILDLDPTRGLERSHERASVDNRYEQMHLSFHKKLRNTFLDIAKSDPKRCKVIDATKNIGEIHQQIIENLLELI